MPKKFANQFRLSMYLYITHDYQKNLDMPKKNIVYFQYV